jgi:colicin import membrane protein
VNRRIRNRLTVAVAAGLILVLPLAGCAAEPVQLEASTAQNLQAAMLDITEAAAAGDFTDAQSLLTTMQADLHAAAAAGQVSAERSSSIQSAINLVSDDLTVEIEAAAVAAEAAAAAAAKAAALAEQQNAEHAENAEEAAEDSKEAADNAREAEKKAAEDAKKAREECLKESDKESAAQCN